MATATLIAKPETETAVKRGPGRPRKNPEATATATSTVAKRRPGRPKGSKNKPKDTATTVTATAPAPAVKRGPGRPRKNPEATATATATVAKRRPGRPKGSKNKPKVTATTTAPAVKRGPGRPKGSKNKPKVAATTTATATAPVVKRGPGRPRKDATAPKSKGVRQVLVNPFKAGESIMIPAGVTFTSTAPTLKGRQVVRRGHKVTVSDSIPVKVQPRNSEKGSNFLVRPARIRAKGSGGYWKDITLTESIIKLNGKTLSYENISSPK